MAGSRRKTDGVAASDEAGTPEERFLKAFDEYGDALFRHASLRISDRERAIDVVHDTYTKVWSYIRSGHEIDAFRPFLYKVLNNLIIDEYRKQKEASLDALFEAEGVDESIFDDLREDTVERSVAKLDGGQALAIISELPDIYREVLLFRYVDELKPTEISVLVEETENTVSVRIHRGLHLLRKIMEERAEIAEAKRGRAQSTANTKSA